MRIGIIGAGKVGGALCKSLREVGVTVIGLTAGTEADTLAAAEKFQVKGFASNEELAASCEILFLTVPDRLVGKVASELAKALGGRLILGPRADGAQGLEARVELPEALPA